MTPLAYPYSPWPGEHMEAPAIEKSPPKISKLQTEDLQSTLSSTTYHSVPTGRELTPSAHDGVDVLKGAQKVFFLLHLLLRLRNRGVCPRRSGRLLRSGSTGLFLGPPAWGPLQYFTR